MSGRHLAITIALLVSFVASACDEPVDNVFPSRSPVGRPLSSESLVIGLVATLTGPESWRGEDAFEGADIAVHALNQSLPDDAMPFELVALDDEGDPQKARSRIEELAGIERSVGIIYAGPEGVLPKTEDLLAARGIAAISIFGDLYAREQLTDHVFQAGPSKIWEARRLASYLARDRRYRSIGVIVPRTKDGEAAADALADSLPARVELEVVTFEDGGSVRPGLITLKTAGVEAVVVSGSPARFSEVIQELESADALYQGTADARIASAPPRLERQRRKTGWWHPQLAGFDHAISVSDVDVPTGTVASDTYARGAHYLPVPSLRSFKVAFVEWWDERPTGREQRSYDATRLIGWAVANSEVGADLAEQIEKIEGRRFGGLDITLGPDDHTLVDQTRVGLWVVPTDAQAVRERGKLPEGLPWVPLARGFSINGKVTDVAPNDWGYLFRNAPPTDAPAPRNTTWRFGVASPRSDPYS